MVKMLTYVWVAAVAKMGQRLVLDQQNFVIESVFEGFNDASLTLRNILGLQSTVVQSEKSRKNGMKHLSLKIKFMESQIICI